MFVRTASAALVILAGAASAQASFEMVLTLQSLGGSYQVARWDAPTGRYMGSIGAGLLDGVSGVGVDPSANDGTLMVGVQTSTRFGFRRIDYSTGEDRGLVTVGVNASVTSFDVGPTGQLLFGGTFSSSKQLRVYSQGMALQRTLSLGATDNVISTAQNTDGSVFALTRSAGSSSGWKYTLRTWNSSSGSGVANLVIDDNVSSAFAFNSINVRGNELVVGASLTSNSLLVPISGALLGAPEDFFGYGLTSRMLVRGHNDALYTFGYNSTDARVEIGYGSTFYRRFTHYRFDTSSTFTGTSFIDGAIVLAPEPASLAALGLGMAALGARKRKVRQTK